MANGGWQRSGKWDQDKHKKWNASISGELCPVVVCVIGQDQWNHV
jgi:hypothetical protein